MNEISTESTPLSPDEWETLARLLQPGLTLVDVAAALVAYGITGPAVEAYRVANQDLDDLEALLEQDPENEAEQFYWGRTKDRGFAALRVIAAAIRRPLPEADQLPKRNVLTIRSRAYSPPRGAESRSTNGTLCRRPPRSRSD